MKVIVTEVFIDKYTSAVYKVGDALDFEDAERVDDLAKRGLVKKCQEEEKKPPKRTRKAKS